MLRDIAKDIPPVKSSRIAAAIVHKGNVISIGTNQRKTHPLQARYNKHEGAIYMHAEINAIDRATKRMSPQDLSDSVLYVVRVKKQANDCDHYIDGNAKPCCGCQQAIDAYNIKTVIHTEDEECAI